MLVRNLAVALLLVARVCEAQTVGSSAPDPFKLTEVFPAGQIIEGPGTNAPRDQTINPAKKTLVLICAGQSNFENVNPTLYTPTNSSVIDNFNIYDGASYPINGPLLGTLSVITAGVGPGNICARLSDSFITGGQFDRVVVVPVAVGSTVVAQWATGGPLATRIPVAIQRLASRGMTPSTPGVTFAMTWGQGENDTLNGTSQASYTASLNSVISNAQAAGFSGRIFVNVESYISGSTSANVTNAQAAVVNNTTIFAGGNLDTLNSSNRFDNIHFNDTGAAAANSLMYNAMHASGAPF